MSPAEQVDTLSCLACGRTIEDGAAFCGRCGEATAAPERKLATLLFADLTGYTALCARLDPEVVHDFVRPVMRGLRQVAESFGGTVPGIQGDGFMAVFGAPVAYEDDAERAVRAALALQDHVRDVNSGESALQIPELHIGVNTGEVVVSAARGSDWLAVAGDAVNIASRLCSLAGTGEIYVGPRTYDLTRDCVDFSPVQQGDVAGIESPVALHRVIGARAEVASGRRQLSLRTGFVGRAETLRELDHVLTRARETRSTQVVAVRGEAGHGKTRLALEWTQRLDGVTVLVGGCSPYGETGVMAPWSDAISSAAGVSQLAPGDDAEERVGQWLGGVTHRSVDSSLPGRLIQLMLPATEGGTTGDDRLRSHLHALGAAFEMLCQIGPLVVILDDLHWASAESISLVEQLHRSPWPLPVVVLGLSRPDVPMPTVPTIDLGALDGVDMQALLDSAIGQPLSAAVADVLLNRSGGNPLFLEECLRMLVEGGGIEVTSAGVHVDEAEVRRIPNSMRQFIAARLDALPPQEKALLQEASVAGDVLWDRMLDALSPSRDNAGLLASLEARGLLRRRLTSSVPGSVEYGFKHALIRDVAYESLPRRARSGRHAAIAAWLENAAAASASGASAPASVLAFHFEQAWELARSEALGGPPSCEAAKAAVTHLLRYADETVRTYPRLAEPIYTRALGIIDEAADCFDAEARALTLLGRARARAEQHQHIPALADLSEVDGNGHGEALAGLRPRALLLRGISLSMLTRFDEAATVFGEALEAFRAVEDAGGVAEALRRRAFNLRFSNRRAYIEGFQEAFAVYQNLGDQAQQREVAGDLAYELTMEGGEGYRTWFALAQSLTDLDADARGRGSLRRTEAYMAQHRGENLRALDLARAAAGDAAMTGLTKLALDAALCQLAATGALGLAEENERTFATASTLAEELGQRRTRAMVFAHSASARARARQRDVADDRLSVARELLGAIGDVKNSDPDILEATIALDSGDWPRLRVLADRVIQAYERDGFHLYPVPKYVDIARSLLGEAPEVAVAACETALEMTRRQDTPQLGAVAALCLEQAQLLAGQPTSAPAGGAPENSAEIRATTAENRGLRAAQQGDWTAAETAFADAAEVWSTLGATIWLVRALVWQACALRAAGRENEVVVVELPIPGLLADLRTPDGVADAFVDQLTAATS